MKVYEKLDTGYLLSPAVLYPYIKEGLRVLEYTDGNAPNIAYLNDKYVRKSRIILSYVVGSRLSEEVLKVNGMGYGVKYFDDFSDLTADKMDLCIYSRPFDFYHLDNLWRFVKDQHSPFFVGRYYSREDERFYENVLFEFCRYRNLSLSFFENDSTYSFKLSYGDKEG
jgi:hypothetical protein